MIHAHFGTTGYWALPVQKSLGIPLVVTFYGTDVVGKKDWQDWPGRRRAVFDQADLILAEGPHMRQKLIDFGCPAEKVQIQHIAIEIDRIPFRARKPKTKEKVIILFAGRFEPKKGLIYAIRAISELRRLGKNVEFRIIGSGAQSKLIRETIASEDLSDCVKLLGFLDYRDYLAELDKADIFLHPSITADDGDNEGGAPTVILEAQARGLPIVSTTHADIPYITSPGKSALLVPERDIDALKDVLIFLIENSEGWEKMGRAGREHVEKNHNIQSQVVKLEDKYFGLL